MIRMRLGSLRIVCLALALALGAPAAAFATPTGACGAGFEAPAAASYAATGADEGHAISPVNATGAAQGWAAASLPVALPLPAAVASNFTICGTSDANKAVVFQAPLLPAPGAPSLSSANAGSLGARTEYYKLTLVNATGETVASTETSIALGANTVAVVASPGAQGNATGYNVYGATASGSETKQNAAPIALTTGWTEPTGGLVSGAAPPGTGTAAAAYIISGGQSLASLVVGPGNSQWVALTLDGTVTGQNNYRVSSQSPAPARAAGIDAGVLPGYRWIYPGGPGYQATQADNGEMISADGTSAGLAVTLPAPSAISQGWGIGLTGLIRGSTVSGGTMYFSDGSSGTSYSVVAGPTTIITFDGAVFHVLPGTMLTPTFKSLTLAPTVSSLISIAPIGNPVTSLGAMALQYTTVSTTTREYGVMLGMNDNQRNNLLASSSNSDTATLFIGMNRQAGGGDAWAINAETIDTSGGQNGQISASEWDVEPSANTPNILGPTGNIFTPGTPAADPGQFSYAEIIAGANSFSATAGSVVSGGPAGFFRGYVCINTVLKSCFADYTSAAISVDIWGSHTVGIDLSNATIGTYILRGTSGTNGGVDLLADGEVRSVALAGHDTGELSLYIGTTLEWEIQEIDTDATLRLRIFDDISGQEDLTILKNGNIGINKRNPQYPLDLNGSLAVNLSTQLGLFACCAQISAQPADGAAAAAYITASGNTAGLALNRADGTYAAPTALVANDLIGFVNWVGWDGTALATGGQIKATATGTWSHGVATSTKVQISASVTGAMLNTEATFQNGIAAGSGTPQGIGTVNAPSGFFVGATAGVTSATCTHWTLGICDHS